ncbi:MAG: histidine--tRNA ligase [Candidatus Cloacimonadaceae bacterium]|nr:histidine--tRNA ligase [Candidatus Cloacimonadaceae bacterium]
MDYKIPRGTYDILPEKSHIWQEAKKVFAEVAASFGYEEIVTPVFEQSDLFERSSGESSDIVQKEMYKFNDRKGRSFALRPEGTAPVVRSYVENRLDLKSRISKLYYSGPMFRYDRPQAGRYRQFYQYGIELIGSNHPYFDAEVIALEWEFLRRLGLKDIDLQINSVGCGNCATDYEQALREYYRPYMEELCPDCKLRYDKKTKRLLDCKVDSCRTIASEAPTQLEYLDSECLAHFESVKAFLAYFDVPYSINPRIVRGLDYYTNTAFEFINVALGAQNSIAGGGRYNNLIEQMGGRSVPAIGFAGGWERLLLSLDNANISICETPKPDAYIVVMGSAALEKAVTLMLSLRREGIWCEYDPDKSSLKAQMKAADAKGATFAIIIGENELAQGIVVLKNLQSSEQMTLSFIDTKAIAQTIRNPR